MHTVKKLSQYNKLWVAVTGAVISGLVSYFGKDSTVVTTAVALVTALGVFFVPNND